MWAAWLCVTAGGASGQMLQGEWVAATEAAIREHRTVPVRIIVMDAAGQPRPLQPVSIRMRRHAFAFGAALTPGELTTNAGVPPASDASERAATEGAEASPVVELGPDRFDLPVWRALSAVSLERAGRWPVVEARRGDCDLTALEGLIAAAEARGLTPRFGELVSADPAGMPAWAAPLRGQSLMDAVDTHVRQMLERFGRRSGEFDLLTSMLTFDVIGDRLGSAGLRRLFEQARATQPTARIGVRFDDSLSGDRLRAMMRRIDELGRLFLPFDHIALDARIDGTVIAPQFARTLDWIAELNKPVVITGLHVSGRTPAAAAVNLETVLRILFAHRAVHGIYFPGLGPQCFDQPHAALLDAEGKPTANGQVFDGLVRRLWWDDLELRTDELGSLEVRLFAGTHEIIARLGDGREVRAVAALRPGEEGRVIALQPLPILRQGPPVEEPHYD